VIGIGGITTSEDALEFLVAGATAIQVGTANFYQPTATEEIVDGLTAYLQERELTSIGQVIGSLQVD